MGGYSKNIAVIRGLKSGFSADGGALSGLVKAEKYGGRLKVEVSLINFAPLTEGRYVTAVSDGKHICILDGTLFEGASETDTSKGFAALVCFVNGTVSPIASAVCGAFQSAAIGIREEIEKQEKLSAKKPPAPVYEDDALAQENYYEYEQAVEDGGTLCKDKAETQDESRLSENAEAACSVEGGEGINSDGASLNDNARKDDSGNDNFVNNSAGRDGENTAIPLAHGKCFYERMKGEIEGVLSDFPAEETLERMVEGSRWVRINYGEGKHYVFGVIYGAGQPQYICYGVPSSDSRRPPESLSGLASFIPSSPDGANKGYWVMYQDASTGASVKIDAE